MRLVLVEFADTSVDNTAMRKSGFRLATGFLGLALGAGIGFGGFYFNSTSIRAGNMSHWMEGIDDGRALTSLRIPGTHNSLAHYAFLDLTGKCQDLDLESQLNAGARFLDLRYDVIGNDLKSMHEFVEERTRFSQDAKIIEKFVKDHPSEFLLVSIREESSSDNSSFESVMRSKMDSSIWDFSPSLPDTIGEARGKAYLLSRYRDPTIGVDAGKANWRDNCTFSVSGLYIEDNYRVQSVEEKKKAIQDSFVSNSLFQLRYYSAYLSPGFPPASAVTVARGINPWVEESLENEDSTGVVIVDFLATSLAEAIVRRN